VALSAGQLMEYGEKRALQAAFGLTLSPATITAIYLALLSAAPAAGTDLTMASETEFATATAYARQSITTGGFTGPTSASPSVLSNTGSITFGPFSSAPGTCTWAMAVDSASGTSSNNLCSFLLATARTPLTGDSLTAAGASFSCTV
jgi:hypothetical protein